MLQCSMQTLFYLGIIFVLGAFVQWLSPKLFLPKVVSYLLLGLIIGPEVLNIIPHSFVNNADVVIEMSLSLIAVMIGASLKFSHIKEVGKDVLYITFFQTIFAFISVSLGFYLFSGLLSLPSEYALVMSILLGGLATATAPAATIAVIHELKAKGKFSRILLGVVALDDAMALILFAFAITLSKAIIDLGEFQFISFLHTFTIIFYSTIIGIAGALLSNLMENLFKSHKGMETISTIGLVFVVYSLNISLSLEPLFSALIMGVFMTNFSKHFDLVQDEIDNHLEEIIFMLFFILSAMHLKFDMIMDFPFVLIAYVLLRLIGKVIGASIGARLANSDEYVKKYMGLALLPQAGLAIGLALSLQDEVVFASITTFILNLIIATTIIHELIGPLLTRYILKKSKEG